MGIFTSGQTPNPDQWNDMAGGALNSNTIASANSITVGDEYFTRITGTTPIQTINTTRNGRTFILQHDPAATDSISFIPGGNINLPPNLGAYYVIPGTCLNIIRDTDDNFNIIQSSISSLAPVADLNLSSGQVGVSGTVTVEIDTATRDNYSAFDASGFDYTIPYTGYYDIYAQVRVGSIGTTGVLVQPFIRSNGATIATARDTNSASGGATEFCQVQSFLQSKGDLITLAVRTDNPSYDIVSGKNNTYLNIGWTF